MPKDTFCQGLVPIPFATTNSKAGLRCPNQMIIISLRFRPANGCIPGFFSVSEAYCSSRTWLFLHRIETKYDFIDGFRRSNVGAFRTCKRRILMHPSRCGRRISGPHLSPVRVMLTLKDSKHPNGRFCRPLVCASADCGSIQCQGWSRREV